MNHLKKYLVSILLLGLINIAYAADIPSIKFFISNNTQEISIEKSYERLNGSAQHILKNSTIDILQNNHIEQGRFENILGTYQMASDGKITGDNTEIFLASPQQHFYDDQVFSLAREMANTFQQESVAVFIPSNQSTVSNIVVKFKSKKPGISETINLINEKLAAYKNAYSLHLKNNHSPFNTAEVREIEWLGGKININEIKKAFPQEVVSCFKGRSYLVYKDGQIEAI